MPLASRNVSGRELSTMTMKPSMPSERISHMKSNRFWPGVPNRYSTRSSSTVMRPKSMATVVVSLTRSASVEILRSVETTSISLTDWMKAVLPALNGPVTTILTVCMIAPRLDRPDAADQPLDERGLLGFVDRGQLAGLRRQRHPFRAHDLNQPGLQQPEHDSADLHVAHLLGLADLADGVLGVDVGDDLPLLDIQVDIANVGAGTLDEVEGHVQVGDLLDQLLVLLQLTGALHNDVLEVEAYGDPVFGRQDVVVEAEVAGRPGEKTVDAGQQVLANARQHVLLREIAGVDQQQAELLVVLFAR